MQARKAGAEQVQRSATVTDTAPISNNPPSQIAAPDVIAGGSGWRATNVLRGRLMERATMSGIPDEKRDELKLNYAWHWFKHHADQRFAAFNFFLIVAGAVIVAYSTAAGNHQTTLGVAVAGLGAVVAAGFFALDFRNYELVKFAVDELKKTRGHGRPRHETDHRDRSVPVAYASLLVAPHVGGISDRLAGRRGVGHHRLWPSRDSRSHAPCQPPCL